MKRIESSPEAVARWRQTLIDKGIIIPVEKLKSKLVPTVTSKHWTQRWLHTLVGSMCGEANTCGKKIDYKEQETAFRAAIAFGRKVDKKFDVYCCWFCGGWHIGGAHELTFSKFCNIVKNWIRLKKRKGTKRRGSVSY